MIAELKTKSGQAVLGDDLVWTSNSNVLAVLLNAAYNPLRSREGTSPADGVVGARQAGQAAKGLGGTLTWPSLQDVDTERVY